MTESRTVTRPYGAEDSDLDATTVVDMSDLIPLGETVIYYGNQPNAAICVGYANGDPVLRVMTVHGDHTVFGARRGVAFGCWAPRLGRG